MTLTYIRYELLRTFRNRRFFLLSLGFPLILYFVIASPNRHVEQLRRLRYLIPPLLHGRHGRHSGR